MEQVQSKKKESEPKWLIYSRNGILTVMLGGMTLMMYDLVPRMVKDYKESRYVMAHLDPNAVSPKESPFKNNLSEGDDIVYEDTDDDGDYESILKRKNSDGEYVNIPMKMGLEGKIEFLNLAENAVDPLKIPNNPWGLKLDYIDTNGNGKLESITYLGLNREDFQRMKIERIEGKYVLTNL